MEAATMIQDSGYDVGNIINNPAVFPEFLNANFLVQFWKGSYRTDSLTGRSCFELRVDQNQTFHFNGCDEGDRGQLSHYMTQSALCTIKSYDNEVEDQREGGVISRVFWTGSPEMSPNISYYSEDEYPHKDFALSCGIRASFCFPFFNIDHDSGWPDGVIEIVSTCNQGVGSVRKICEAFEGLGLCLPGFISTNIRKYAIPEMDNLLDVVCRTFQLPLAQYWVAPDLFEALSMVHQYSNRNFENLAPWSQFKDACWHKSLTVGEGPLGNSCTSHEAFFCKDIAALSITNYPFAHYARNCGSISCFTIYLCYKSLPCTTCVLEFFLPAQEMDIYYPQTLLNSLWATMKERIPNHMLASGKELGHGLSVGVINSSSSHNEPKSFEIGQPDRSHPHHEGSGYTCTLNMFENCTAQKINSNSYEEAATEETLKTIPNEVTEIILENLEDESHIKYIGPPSLASQPKRPINISQYDEGNSNLVEIDHSAPEMTLEEPSKLKSHTATADERVDEPEVSTVKDIGYATTTASKREEKFTEPVTLESLHNQFRIPLDDTAKSFEEPVERSNVEDLECATSNTDVGCATSNADIVYAMTTASQPSRFQTMKMPCQLGEVETMVLENEGQPQSSLVHHEGPGNEGEASQELTCISQLLFRHGTKQNKHVLDIIKCTPEIKLFEENATIETSKGRITVDEVEEKSSIKCVERNIAEEILEDEGDTVGMDHSGLEMTFAHKKYTLTAVRGDESVEESIVEDVGDATSNADIGCATSNVLTLVQISRLQTMKMLRQQVEEETMVPECEREASEQLTRISHLLFEDGTKQNEQVLGMPKSIPNIILHEEIATGEVSNRPPNNDTKINYVDELEGESLVKLIEPQPLNSQLRRSEETFRDEGNTLASDKDELVEVSRDEDLEYAKTTGSKRLKISNTSFTLENIRKHFGRPQKDAAESFGVSLSTFKRNCRLVGITRWQPGKRKLIDNETGQRNFSSGMPHVQDVQDTPAVAPTGQELNNMDVKVMYNGVPIRFEIPTSSGITELENNVIERLPLNKKSFSIKYQDDEGDWVLIACDKDVQKCFEISRSLKKATIKMLLDPPVT